MTDGIPAVPPEEAHAIHGRTLDGRTFLVLLRGDLDRAGHGPLEAAAEAFRTSACTHAVVDLTSLTFLNARGLTFMAALERRCRSLGGTVVLLNAGHDVIDLLMIAGMAERFRFVHSPTRGDPTVPAPRSCHPLEY